MNTLFVRSLFSIVFALVIFLCIMAAFVFFGFDRSLESWSTSKFEEIEAQIISLLENSGSVPALTIRDDISVFIYGPDERLIFTNRGERRRRPISEEEDIRRVTINGELAGYYHIGRVAFQSDAANRRFISSMSRVLVIGAVVSCMISVVYAYLFSRSMSKPATIVADGIRRIASGDLEKEIPETGVKEVSQIAVAANDLKRQLSNEQKLRLQWAQDIAHDLRTPISALKAQFEGMRDGVLPANPRRIEQNISEIYRVETLINDLQELMQLENPELRPDRSDVQLDELFREIAVSFSLETEKKDICLELQPSGITLSADENLLHRALSNIMSNALRHTNPGGSIKLSSTSDDRYVSIGVTNTGEVISEEELKHVFDRLFRGDHARNTPGSGLGLTISRQIVELHGGTITMRSSVKDGTTVELRIPIDRG